MKRDFDDRTDPEWAVKQTKKKINSLNIVSRLVMAYTNIRLKFQDTTVIFF